MNDGKEREGDGKGRRVISTMRLRRAVKEVAYFISHPEKAISRCCRPVRTFKGTSSGGAVYN